MVKEKYVSKIETGAGSVRNTIIDEIQKGYDHSKQKQISRSHGNTMLSMADYADNQKNYYSHQVSKRSVNPVPNIDLSAAGLNNFG